MKNLKAEFIAFIAMLEVDVALGLFRIIGLDNGKGGRYFEARVKLLLGNTRGCIVSRQGKVDTRKAGVAFAIKSGYGILYHTDADGNPTSKEFTGSAYTIWIADPNDDPRDALVVPTQDILDSDIIRRCYGTRMYQRHTDKTAPKGSLVEGAYQDQVNFLAPSGHDKVDQFMLDHSIDTLENVIYKLVTEKVALYK